MPEEFAFEKACGHRRAVHLDQIAASARAELVNRSRDDFLARPGLASDQNGSICGCHGLDLGKDRAQAPAASHDRLEE